jgi:hypothetical protein
MNRFRLFVPQRHTVTALLLLAAASKGWPGDEDAIERGAVWGIGTVRVTLHFRSRGGAPGAGWCFHGWLLRVLGWVRPAGFPLEGRLGCRSARAMEARSRCWRTSRARVSSIER